MSAAFAVTDQCQVVPELEQWFSIDADEHGTFWLRHHRTFFNRQAAFAALTALSLKPVDLTPEQVKSKRAYRENPTVIRDLRMGYVSVRLEEQV